MLVFALVNLLSPQTIAICVPGPWGETSGQLKLDLILSAAAVTPSTRPESSGTLTQEFLNFILFGKTMSIYLITGPKDPFCSALICRKGVKAKHRNPR